MSFSLKKKNPVLFMFGFWVVGFFDEEEIIICTEVTYKRISIDNPCIYNQTTTVVLAV